MISFSFSAMTAPADDVTLAPSQLLIIQHLKLIDAQESKIKALHQQLADNMDKVNMKSFK